MKKKKFLAQFTLLIANAKREPSSRIRESRKTRKRALKQSRPRTTHRTAIHSRCSMAHTCTVRLYSRPFSSRYSYYFHSHQPLWEAISTSLEDLSFSSIRQHASPRLHISKNFQFRKEIFSRVLYIWLDWEVEYSILFLSWRTFIVYYFENLIRLRSLVLDSFFLGQFFFKIFWWCYICILYSRSDSTKKYSTHSYKDFLTIMLRILRSRPDSIKKSSIRIFFFLREFFF